MSNDGYKFLSLINYCNTQLSNSNEYNIAHIILQNVNQLKSMSLEELSKRANISESSVSRFIKKMGFKSYQDFRESFPKALLETRLNRRLDHVTMFPYDSDEQIFDRLHEDGLRHLNSTRSKLDKEQLLQVIELIKNAASVTFYGDDHTLSIFYTFQLDLLSNGVPAYLFKTEQIQLLHSDFLSDNDIIIFLNIYTDFLTPHQMEIIRKLKQNSHIKLIGFSQESKSGWDELFDIMVNYGIPGSTNDGFYSLLYLNQVLSELYYHHQ